jgi:predicted transcriptional regulator
LLKAHGTWKYMGTGYPERKAILYLTDNYIYMRLWRVSGFLFLFFILLSPVAYAQQGYNHAPYEPDSDHPDYDQNESFWQLPDWFKLFFISSMAVSFIGLLKALPFVLGKIDDLLKNENRHNILNYIYSNPGATVAEVAQAQSIERGTVKYHLYKLESEGKIVLNRMGKYSRVFRNSNTYSDFEKTVIAHLQNQTARSVLLMIHDQPGITNQEMAERLGVEKSAVHWHVDKFLSDGLISYRRDGKFKRYFLGENSCMVLEKYTDRLT